MRNVFQFTDAQWSLITKRLKLPDDARAHIEFAVHAYRGQRVLWHRTPAALTKLLARTSATASKLTKLLAQIGEQGHIEIVEAWPRRERADFKMIAAGIEGLSAACASAQASDMSRKFLLDQLIVNLDPILQTFVNRGVSRAKPVMAFLSAVCSVADRDLGAGSIEDAVKRLQGRGEIATKNTKKSTSEIRR